MVGGNRFHASRRVIVRSGFAPAFRDASRCSDPAGNPDTISVVKMPMTRYVQKRSGAMVIYLYRIEWLGAVGSLNLSAVEKDRSYLEVATDA